jgi:hypothetical protein
LIRGSKRTFTGGAAAGFLRAYSLKVAQPATLGVGVTVWNLHLCAAPYKT